MAINPNTDFVVSQVLTAAEQNRFPRGIVAQVVSTTNFSVTTTQTVALTASTFTAVANRYYRITYMEPAMQGPGGAGNFITAQIRQTNATGTILGTGQLQFSGATQVAQTLHVTALATFTAGSVVIVATAAGNTGTCNLFRVANQVARLIVEDIGPA